MSCTKVKLSFTHLFIRTCVCVRVCVCVHVCGSHGTTSAVTPQVASLAHGRPCMLDWMARVALTSISHHWSHLQPICSVSQTLEMKLTSLQAQPSCTYPSFQCLAASQRSLFSGYQSIVYVLCWPRLSLLFITLSPLPVQTHTCLLLLLPTVRPSLTSD